MKKTKVIALFLAAAMAGSLAACGGSQEGADSGKKEADSGKAGKAETETETETEEGAVKKPIGDDEVALTVTEHMNPLVGDSPEGDYFYGGDPSVLVDGDTVYLYTGHDVATGDAYNIPEYVCYSSTDLLNWKSEGTVMKVDTNSVSWASGSDSAWAAQVAKHHDEESGKDKYYLYFCTWDKTSDGKQSIGVAVSDSPTGPFEDIGQPLVKGTVTEPETSGWNDIDPTVWIEKDEEGTEHRYLAWGNGKYYICELNEDMVSVKDQNGDGQITSGASTAEADIVNKQVGLNSFTEAPWLYRRQDENGNYYGSYYLFYAFGWREQMAYATIDDLLNGTWTYGSIIMRPSVTSNTNHMAVFDFKGKTYFIYHNGMLPGGSGFRRSANIAEVVFGEDGKVEMIPETAAGIAGTVSTIALANGDKVGHAHFDNSAGDAAYPYKDIACGVYVDVEPEWEKDFEESDTYWVICDGKADRTNAAYVSIQSENKPGLYITVNDDLTVTLAQEDQVSKETEAAQTFHTVKGLGDESGVSFESVSRQGQYLTMKDKVLCLTDGSDAASATFFVSDN